MVGFAPHGVEECVVADAVGQNMRLARGEEADAKPMAAISGQQDELTKIEETQPGLDQVWPAGPARSRWYRASACRWMRR